MDFEKLGYTKGKEKIESLGWNGSFAVMAFDKIPENIMKAICKDWLESHNKSYDKHEQKIQEYINAQAVKQMCTFVLEAKEKYNANISPQHAMNHLMNEGFSSDTAIEITSQAKTNSNGYCDFSMGWHK